MSKVIDSNKNWYQEVAPRDYYNEGDLERTILLYLKVMFPEFKAFLFKQDLLNNITGSKSAPDLGMVKYDYTEWYIIEVELGKHSKAEVLKQIETFRNFTPSQIHAQYIKKKRPLDFDVIRLTSLITSRSPQLMVIVNEYKNDWKKDLLRLGCKMCVFQIYNDFYGKRMYRLDGEHPFIFTDFCNCKYEKTVLDTIKVLNNDFLENYGIKNGKEVAIEYKGINYIWKREDAGNDVFLICKNDIPPLDPLSSRYRLNCNSRFSTSNNKRSGIFTWLRKMFSIEKKEGPNLFSFEKD